MTTENQGVGRQMVSDTNPIAAHDVYHAGQIQLLKRLRGTRIPSRG